MAYTAGAGIHLATIAIQRSREPRRLNLMKPSNYKLACRAQNKPLTDGTQVQGGVSRSLAYEKLIDASAAVGTALSAFASPTSGWEKDISIYPPGKLYWPELVGEKGEVALATIKKENPYIQPILMQEGSFRVLHLVPNRVFVVGNGEGVVTHVPIVG